MRTLLIVVVVAAALVQAGCANYRPAPPGPVAMKKDKTCDDDKVPCSIVVTAVSADPDHCTVEADVKNIKIPSTKKPQLVWTLNPRDAYVYQFIFDPDLNAPIYGVTIVDNDPRTDFDKPGRSKDGTTFTWASVHKNPSERDYGFVVLRTSPKGDPRPPMICTMLDPKIVNE